MFAQRLHVLVSSMLMIAILMPEMQSAQSDVFHYVQKRQAMDSRRRYCGENLSSILQTTCVGNYNSRFKKSSQDMETEDYASSFNSDLYPYKSIESARKMFRLRRIPRGIYEECCKNPCTTDELRTYCAAYP